MKKTALLLLGLVLTAALLFSGGTSSAGPPDELSSATAVTSAPSVTPVNALERVEAAAVPLGEVEVMKIARRVELAWDALSPLTWTWWNYGTHELPVFVPAMKCPGGHVFLIRSHHTIAPDGTVSPSMVCPYRCNYHEFVQLELAPGDFDQLAAPPHPPRT